MVYVFGKALLFSGPSQHVTKHVLAKLMEDQGPGQEQEAVRAIWRDEFVFDPQLVDPDFRELLIRAMRTDPTEPDRCIKCGVVEDIVEEGPEIGAPTDAVLAPLPSSLPATTEFGLGVFERVYVTTEQDIVRLGELGIGAELWFPPIPAFDPSAIAVPELDEPDLSLLEPTALEKAMEALPWGLGERLMPHVDEGARRLKSWRRRVGL